MTLSGKNILVTGGAGFVGGHLCETLIKLGARVIVADIDLNKKSYLFTEKLHRRTTVIRMNVCDYKKLTLLLKRYRIDFIFHLAAQALVEHAYADPKYTLENNILSTINVLEAARCNPQIKGIIVASSDKAYGDLHKKKYKEADPLFGDHPYEVSKSATDLICSSYFKTYGTPVVITRFGNIYGEGDLNYSRLLPGLLQAVATGTTFKVRSDGKYIRDYLYVKDVVGGYVLLAKHLEKIKGEAFNFGSTETHSVIEVIRLAEKSLGRKIKFKIMNTAKKEIPYQSLNFDKIRKSVGWKNTYSLKGVLPTLYNWYNNHL